MRKRRQTGLQEAAFALGLAMLGLSGGCTLVGIWPLVLGGPVLLLGGVLVLLGRGERREDVDDGDA